MTLTISSRPAGSSCVRARLGLNLMMLSASDAVIAPEKLRDCILAPTHPDGRAKAAYLARLGYAQSDWRRLEEDLRQQILSRDAGHAKRSAYGQKHEILGPLTGPNGTAAWMRSIWRRRDGSYSIDRSRSIAGLGRPGGSATTSAGTSPSNARTRINSKLPRAK
jgi:uncharacterized protein DUF6883